MANKPQSTLEVEPEVPQEIDQRTGAAARGASAGRPEHRRQQLIAKRDADMHEVAAFIAEVRSDVTTSCDVRPYGGELESIDVRKLEQAVRAELQRIVADSADPRCDLAARALRQLEAEDHFVSRRDGNQRF